MALDNFKYYDSSFRSQARTASLYSDFRSQRTTNPEGYEANCKAWLNVLECGVLDLQLGSDKPGRRDGYLIHAGEGLLQSLASPQYGKPLALDAVLEYGISTGKLMPLQDFLKSRTSIHNKSSLPSAWQVISWGLGKIGFAGKAHSVSKDLVPIGVLQDSVASITKSLHRSVTSRASSVYTKEMALRLFSNLCGAPQRMNPDDWSVLTTYLSRDCQLITYDAASETIKFRYGSEARPGAISQEDIDTASLRALIDTLEQQVAKLYKQVDELDQNARNAIAAKNTLAAKSALRSKKLAQSTLQQRNATLGQLEEVFVKIERAADQVEIVHVMEAAGRTLKSLNEKTGGVDKVNEVMDILKEEAMNTDEISQAINEDTRNAVDEAEVDDELEKLEESIRKAKAAKEQAAKKAQLDREAEETRIRLAALESPTKSEVKESAGTEPTQEKAVAGT